MIENVDFVTFSKNLESGGKQIEYAVTLDMAKELSCSQDFRQLNFALLVEMKPLPRSNLNST